MPISPPPPISTPDPTGDYARAQSWSLITAKYADAGSWAQWAAGILNTELTAIKEKLGKDLVSTDLEAVKTAIDAIVLYDPTGFTASYTAPDAPVFTDVPVYEAQTLGTILTIPAVDAITVADPPSAAMTFTNDAFSDALLDALKTKLTNDLTNGSTGLMDAEAGMFARAVQRENDILAEAYDQITTGFSSKGFDLPPGALTALQARESNKSVIRLTDVNTGILELSAKLAQAWNQTSISASAQILDLVGRLFDSKVMRDFEAEKARVTLSIEAFKQTVSVALAKAELNKAEISATISANEGTVKVFEAELQGQIAPMKAIAESNQAVASAYGAAVQGATADVNSQILPEELKIKGMQANGALAGTQAQVALEMAKVAIETSVRELSLEVATMGNVANGAQQMIASALNSVSSSSTFGWNAGANTSYQGK